MLFPSGFYPFFKVICFLNIIFNTIYSNQGFPSSISSLSLYAFKCSFHPHFRNKQAKENKESKTTTTTWKQRKYTGTQTWGQAMIKPWLLHFLKARTQVQVQHGDLVLFSKKANTQKYLSIGIAQKAEAIPLNHCLAFTNSTHSTPLQDVCSLLRSSYCWFLSVFRERKETE